MRSYGNFHSLYLVVFRQCHLLGDAGLLLELGRNSFTKFNYKTMKEIVANVINTYTKQTFILSNKV